MALYNFDDIVEGKMYDTIPFQIVLLHNGGSGPQILDQEICKCIVYEGKTSSKFVIKSNGEIILIAEREGSCESFIAEMMDDYALPPPGSSLTHQVRPLPHLYIHRYLPQICYSNEGSDHSGVYPIQITYPEKNGSSVACAHLSQYQIEPKKSVQFANLGEPYLKRVFASSQNINSLTYDAEFYM